jgi:hypothetical protein
MTDMITNEKPSQYKIELLLPWHAAGTLNSRDADEVEKTLAQDKELARPFAMVREEMNETILLNETLGAPSARAMENLFKAIDKERKGVRSRAASGLGAWLTDLFTPRVLESRVLIYSASAAAPIMVLQSAVIAKLVLADRGGGGATFETASAPISATRGIDVGSYALVRFAAHVNIADMTKFLDSRGALIVDGPRPGGMYRVRIARTRLAADERARAVKEFQFRQQSCQLCGAGRIADRRRCNASADRSPGLILAPLATVPAVEGLAAECTIGITHGAPARLRGLVRTRRLPRCVQWYARPCAKEKLAKLGNCPGCVLRVNWFEVRRFGFWGPG